MFDFDALHKTLFSMQDFEYRKFQCRLMPGVPEDSVIGIRTPQLRSLAKTLSENPCINEFLDCLPHSYYEEYNLHGYLIERIKNGEECARRIDEFLPFVNNWATCDTLKSKALAKNPSFLLEKSREWIASGKTYSVRFGIEMLMNYFLDGGFSPEYIEIVASVKSSEYYVNMMIAWYFATALAKQWDETFPYIKEQRLSEWCHNKTIQKSLESFRITDEQKKILRALKI